MIPGTGSWERCQIGSFQRIAMCWAGNAFRRLGWVYRGLDGPELFEVRMVSAGEEGQGSIR